MVSGCTWSLEGDITSNLVLQGQYKAVLAGTWWYLVRTGKYSVICFQKLYGLHGLNHQIIEYSTKEKSDYGKTNKQNFLSE